MVDYMLWEHEVVGSSPVFPTKNPTAIALIPERGSVRE